MRLHKILLFSGLILFSSNYAMAENSEETKAAEALNKKLREYSASLFTSSFDTPLMGNHMQNILRYSCNNTVQQPMRDSKAKLLEYYAKTMVEDVKSKAYQCTQQSCVIEYTMVMAHLESALDGLMLGYVSGLRQASTLKCP